MRGLLVNPLRTGLYEVLEAMGADIELSNERIQSGEIVADMTLRHAPLAPCHVTAERIPAMIDEIPALAVACAFADGESVIEGLAELRVKESDRLGAIVAGLAACGVAAIADGDALRIFGRGKVRGGASVVTQGDHRIAMAFLTLGLAAEQPVEVDERRDDRHQLSRLRRGDAGLGCGRGHRMSINSFGHLLRLTTWGESHGPAIGCVVDGCPPGLELDEAHVQRFLDLRRPGTAKNVSPRQEPDQVRILSGVYEGRTTGTPIALMIDNVDARSADYPKPMRPTGRAMPISPMTPNTAFAIRAAAGGRRRGRRRCGSRRRGGAAGHPRGEIAARVVEIGGEADAEPLGGDARRGAGRGRQPGRGRRMRRDRRARGLGRAGLCQARCRAGRGLHGDQCGQGRRDRRGLRRGAADGQRESRRRCRPAASTAAFRPASRSSSASRSSRRRASAGKGRHDPCVGIRGAPVVEAMVALVLADHKLLHRGQCG